MTIPFTIKDARNNLIQCSLHLSDHPDEHALKQLLPAIHGVVIRMLTTIQEPRAVANVVTAALAENKET